MLKISRTKVEVPYVTRWWGADVICDPRFVEEALGDGNVLLAFTPLDTRPNHYLIRIDSRWHLSGCRCEGECPDDLFEHLEEIYQAIEEQYGNACWAQEEDKEAEQDTWPALSEDNGSCWCVVDAKCYLQRPKPQRTRPRNYRARAKRTLLPKGEMPMNNTPVKWSKHCKKKGLAQ